LGKKFACPLSRPYLGRDISPLYLKTNQAGNLFIELGETIFQAGEMPPELNKSFKKLGEGFPYLGEEFPHVWQGKNKVERRANCSGYFKAAGKYMLMKSSSPGLKKNPNQLHASGHPVYYSGHP
jgi:hypothetical protein